MTKRRRSPQSFGAIVVPMAILAPLAAVTLAWLPGLDHRINPIPTAWTQERAQIASEQILDRLQWADTLLRVVGRSIEQHGVAPIASSPQTFDIFSNVTLLDGANATTVIKGSATALTQFDTRMYARLRAGHPAIVLETAGEQTRIALLRTVSSENSDHAGLLIAELTPAYLTRAIDGGTSRVSACVQEQSGRVLFCNSDSTGSAPSPLAGDTTAGTHGSSMPIPFTATSDVRPFRVPVASQFGGKDWFVSIDMHHIDAAATARVYIASGMITVIFALLLAQLWVRRSYSAEPVRASPEHVEPKGLSQRHDNKGPAFSHSATDTSSVTTSPAVGLLRLFAEIDRAILSGATFERIVESVMPSVRVLLPGTTTGLALLDQNRPANCRLLIFGADNSRHVHAIGDALDAASTAALTSMPDGGQLDSSPGDALLSPFHKLGMQHCVLFPIFKDGSPVGALILASQLEEPIENSTRSNARDIAQRLGVAYTTAARGQELQFHSLYDSTTELPNRKFFETRLDEEISRARRESSQLALLLIDLDNFKKINDSFGHDGGDLMLEEASMRLKSCLRAEDLVARVGNDEFGVMLPTIASDGDASRVAEKLLMTLARPYTIAGREQRQSATIGVAVFPKDGKTSQALFRSADFAMHTAKQNGGATYSTYEPLSDAHAKDQAALANDLRAATSHNELTLYFQPQVDLACGEIVGAEALIRWNHQTRGMVMPTTFISIAEQTNHIEEIGTFVRREAGYHFRKWEQEGTAPARVSVNVSSRELSQPDFVEMVENALSSSGMRPFSLELEITESLLMETSEHVTTILKALSARGVRIAIDDFGTGYSSMAYLKNLPFHVLKIDRSFVKGIGTNDGSESIIDAIIGVAKGLGKQVVAEGIETEAQRAFLAAKGCDFGQGFLWSPPIPASEFSIFMRNWNRPERRLKSIN